MASQQLLGAVAAALVLLAASPVPAPAQGQAPDRRHLASASVEALQRTYLECDRVATNTPLDLASAAHCSMVGEELKHRVYGGEFERLLAWWRANRWTGAEAVSDAQTHDYGPDIP
ncbi:hypothetical protein C7T35_31210 [Variovorax sp. WS11]|uniref:hypothetical protein n=1 Tax=Variovorax sp. WS11 TaxID=1105204 RepID=UPI000D0D7506|nr:hypothetical protein [Variovorax sp. WS11]NDZ15853.1 hypothetical protein [Variovorax sp. WS11]PSL80646.1 hypothetical protein C7T35_31210 [Variovorax sp. WS11]